MTKALVLASLAAVVLSGCGGERLSRAEYVAKLNAMCDDFAAREKVIGEPQGLADVVAHGQEIADAFDHSFGPIDDLGAPDGVAVQAKRLRNLTDEQSRVLRGLANAAEKSDMASVSSLAARNDALNADLTSIARALGAASCATPQ